MSSSSVDSNFSMKMNESSGELSDISDQLSDITEIISDVGTDGSDVDTEEDIQPAPGRNANPWFSDLSCLHLRLIAIFQNILRAYSLVQIP
jgi:hypothetical protein